MITCQLVLKAGFFKTFLLCDRFLNYFVLFPARFINFSIIFIMSVNNWQLTGGDRVFHALRLNLAPPPLPTYRPYNSVGIAVSAVSQPSVTFTRPRLAELSPVAAAVL